MRYCLSLFLSTMFTVHPDVHPDIQVYCSKPSTRHLSFNRKRGKYAYGTGENQSYCGGLVSYLKYKFYPQFKRSKTKRKRSTKVRGSTSSIGKRVDQQLMELIAERELLDKKLHPFTVRLLEEWEEMGHQLQASQLPVRIPQWDRMTQADIITRDKATGQLWMWEVKTGFPVGGTRSRGMMKGPLKTVKCTEIHTWYMQCHYTKLALLQAGIPIHQSRVIQVWTDRSKEGVCCKIHKEPTWLKKAPRLKKVTYKPVVPQKKKTK